MLKWKTEITINDTKYIVFASVEMREQMRKENERKKRVELEGEEICIKYEASAAQKLLLS